MRRPSLWYLMIAGAVFAAAPVRAAGDPEAGHQLAERWCARCHDIGPGGQMKQDPPSFAAIAVYRSPEQIKLHILQPHGSMPEIAQILGLNVDNLVAYITSLEKPAK